MHVIYSPPHNSRPRPSSALRTVEQHVSQRLADTRLPAAT